MSPWESASLQANIDSFAQGGEPISYVKQGQITKTVCLLSRVPITQSSAPGFFADIEVDPLVITDPKRGDEIEWKDGVIYVVGSVIRDPYGLTALSLHRKFDPTAPVLIS